MSMLGDFTARWHEIWSWSSPCGAAEGLSEGQLLRRFAAGRDEAAFFGFGRQARAMVLGVCRRVLDDLGSSDPFALFLVLVGHSPMAICRSPPW